MVDFLYSNCKREIDIQADSSGYIKTFEVSLRKRNKLKVNITKPKRLIHKEPILQNLFKTEGSSLEKYQEFFVGDQRLVDLIKFELISMLLTPMPGAFGLLLRKWLYPCLFRRVGSDVLWGRNVTFRHARRIEVGDRVAVDDDCLLDAKGAGDGGIQIGNDVLIARGSIIQGKTSWIKIGDCCIIGSQCQLSSAGGIHLGKWVRIAGQCYIGGGSYQINDREIPTMNQGVYSKGPVIIEDDVWLGAGTIVQDGVKIGKGCRIGSGTIVREDVPEYTVATPHQKLVMLPRGQS